MSPNWVTTHALADEKVNVDERVYFLLSFQWGGREGREEEWIRKENGPDKKRAR